MSDLCNIAYHCRSLASKAGDKNVQELAKLVERLAFECERIEKAAADARRANQHAQLAILD
jgi:hypothetical protein